VSKESLKLAFILAVLVAGLSLIDYLLKHIGEMALSVLPMFSEASLAKTKLDVL
jgi:hypothetical protein